MPGPRSGKSSCKDGKSTRGNTATLSHSIMQLMDSQSSGERARKMRGDLARKIHNGMEKRRKDRINTWIMKINDVLPDNDPKKESKSYILERTYDHLKYLMDNNEKLMRGQISDVQSGELNRLKKRIDELERKNKTYCSLLESAGLTPHAVPDSIEMWQHRPGKYTNKITAEKLKELIETNYDDDDSDDVPCETSKNSKKDQLSNGEVSSVSTKVRIRRLDQKINRHSPHKTQAEFVSNSNGSSSSVVTIHSQNPSTQQIVYLKNDSSHSEPQQIQIRPQITPQYQILSSTGNVNFDIANSFSQQGQLIQMSPQIMAPQPQPQTAILLPNGQIIMTPQPQQPSYVIASNGNLVQLANPTPQLTFQQVKKPEPQTIFVSPISEGSRGNKSNKVIAKKPSKVPELPPSPEMVEQNSRITRRRREAMKLRRQQYLRQFARKSLAKAKISSVVSATAQKQQTTSPTKATKSPTKPSSDILARATESIFSKSGETPAATSSTCAENFVLQHSVDLEKTSENTENETNKQISESNSSNDFAGTPQPVRASVGKRFPDESYQDDLNFNENMHLEGNSEQDNEMSLILTTLSEDTNEIASEQIVRSNISSFLNLSPAEQLSELLNNPNNIHLHQVAESGAAIAISSANSAQQTPSSCAQAVNFGASSAPNTSSSQQPVYRTRSNSRSNLFYAEEDFPSDQPQPQPQPQLPKSALPQTNFPQNKDHNSATVQNDQRALSSGNSSSEQPAQVFSHVMSHMNGADKRPEVSQSSHAHNNYQQQQAIQVASQQQSRMKQTPSRTRQQTVANHNKSTARDESSSQTNQTRNQNNQHPSNGVNSEYFGSGQQQQQHASRNPAMPWRSPIPAQHNQVATTHSVASTTHSHVSQAHQAPQPPVAASPSRSEQPSTSRPNSSNQATAQNVFSAYSAESLIRQQPENQLVQGPNPSFNANSLAPACHSQYNFPIPPPPFLNGQHPVADRGVSSSNVANSTRPSHSPYYAKNLITPTQHSGPPFSTFFFPLQQHKEQDNSAHSQNAAICRPHENQFVDLQQQSNAPLPPPPPPAVNPNKELSGNNSGDPQNRNQAQPAQIFSHNHSNQMSAAPDHRTEACHQNYQETSQSRQKAPATRSRQQNNNKSQRGNSNVSSQNINQSGGNSLNNQQHQNSSSSSSNTPYYAGQHHHPSQIQPPWRSPSPHNIHQAPHNNNNSVRPSHNVQSPVGSGQHNQPSPSTTSQNVFSAHPSSLESSIRQPLENHVIHGAGGNFNQNSVSSTAACQPQYTFSVPPLPVNNQHGSLEGRSRNNSSRSASTAYYAKNFFTTNPQRSSSSTSLPPIVFPHLPKEQEANPLQAANCRPNEQPAQVFSFSQMSMNVFETGSNCATNQSKDKDTTWTAKH